MARSSKLILAIKNLVLKNIYPVVENHLEQDIIVLIQDPAGKQDIGLAVHGKEY